MFSLIFILLFYFIIFILFFILFCRRNAGVELNIRYSSEILPPVAYFCHLRLFGCQGSLQLRKCTIKKGPPLSFSFRPSPPAQVLHFTRCRTPTTIQLGPLLPPIPRLYPSFAARLFRPLTCRVCPVPVASLQPWFTHAEGIDSGQEVRPVPLLEMGRVLPGLP